jgi:hypothetical protein
MKRHILLVAALVAAALVGTASPAAAVTNLISIASYTNGQCADVLHGSQSDRTPVVAEPCAHYAEQLWWVYQTADNSGAFEFKNYLTDKCLATSRDDINAVLIQTTCHGGTEQQWTYNGSPTWVLPVPGASRYHFVNRRSGLCMQTGGVNGAHIGTNYCGSTRTDQLWVVNN